MTDNGRKITIRMPDKAYIGAGFVTKILVEDGGRARGGTPVLNVKLDDGKQAIRAPRAGKVYSMVERGQRVEPGDPLFVLLIDESALAKGKRREAKLQLMEKERADEEADSSLPALFDEDEFVKPIVPYSRGFQAREFIDDWGRLVLVGCILMAAWFGLMPFLTVTSATSPDWISYALTGLLAVLAMLVVLVFGGNASIWPRRVMASLAVVWTVVAGGVVISSAGTTPDPTAIASVDKRDIGSVITDLFTSDDIYVNKRVVEIKAPKVAMRTSLFVHFRENEDVPARTIPDGLYMRDDPVLPAHEFILPDDDRSRAPSKAADSDLLQKTEHDEGIAPPRSPAPAVRQAVAAVLIATKN